jgi:hypothetical protein
MLKNELMQCNIRQIIKFLEQSAESSDIFLGWGNQK